MRLSLLSLSVVSLFSVVMLSGCSTAFTSGLIGANPDGALSGQAYGGQQPIVGAAIYVYAASTTGYGGNGIAASAANASTSLINGSTTAISGYPIGVDGNGNYYVTTDANGTFKIDGTLPCTVGSQLYLYSLGGNPSSGVNTAAGLLAVLGNCGDGLVEDSVGSNTRIVINEAATVAAGYSTAGFATDATHIGALSTSDALAATGLANAFANAAQLYSLTYGSTTARATTPYGNGTVPTSEINSIANSLASCVNSSGPGSTACGTLFGDAKSGGSTGTTPTDTATAAINIAHNPTANVKAIFNLASSSIDPFAPFLSTRPANFTVSLSFTGGGLTNADATVPQALAVDSLGNVWASNYDGNSLSELSPLGVPANTAGYTVGNLSGPYGIAIDTANNVWVANQGSNAVTVLTSSGTLYENYQGNAYLTPYGIAIDGSGNAWVAATATRNGTSTVLELTSAATLKRAATGNGLEDPYTVAVEPGPTGNVWVANYLGEDASAFTNAGAAYVDPAVVNFPNSVAIDSGGNVWYADFESGALKLNSSGTQQSNTTTFTADYYLDGVAIDGGGNVWLTDLDNGTIYEVNNAGTNISATAGFALTDGADPDAIAIDGSGDVWYNAESGAPLRELIGAAVPVATPLAYGVTNSLLGTRP